MVKMVAHLMIYSQKYFQNIKFLKLIFAKTFFLLYSYEMLIILDAESCNIGCVCNVKILKFQLTFFISWITEYSV